MLPKVCHSYSRTFSYNDSRHYQPKITKMLYSQSMRYYNWILTDDQSIFPFQPLYSSSDMVPSIAVVLFETSLLSQTLLPWLCLSHLFFLGCFCHSFSFHCKLFYCVTRIFIFLSTIMVKILLSFPRANIPPTLTCGSSWATLVWNIYCDDLTLKILKYFHYLRGLLPYFCFLLQIIHKFGTDVFRHCKSCWIY